jgi:integrase
VLPAVAVAVATAAAGRGTEALTDPAFALDVLAAVEASGLDSEAAPMVARVLDLLRRRSGTPAAAALADNRPRTLSAALAEYETSGFLALARNTRRTYRTWNRRLAVRHGRDDVAGVRTGDLTNLITARIASRPDPRTQRVRRVTGVRTHITAVQAFRHFWAWLDAMGYADATVAKALRLPGKPRSSHRRGYTRAEADVVRQLCRVGADPLLANSSSCSPSGPCCGPAIQLLRLCDLDFRTGTIEVWGKGRVPRTIPMAPGLREFLLRYAEDRRPPASARRRGWPARNGCSATLPPPPSRSAPPLDARRSSTCGRGSRSSPPSCSATAGSSALVPQDRRVLAQPYLQPRRREEALGHERSTPTDYYIEVPMEELREALTGYEQWLLDPAEPAVEAA